LVVVTSATDPARAPAKAAASDPAAPRRRLPRAAREQQLLDVAEQVFAEQGYSAASMDDIAIRAGVTKPVLYSHFGSKEGLVVACVARARSQLLEDTIVGIGDATDFEQQLRRGIRAFFRFLDERHPAWSVLILEISVQGAAAEEIEAIRRQQADVIADALATGAPGISRLRLSTLAEGVIGACERVAMFRRRHPELTAEAATDELMTLLWAGLAALRGPSGA
jgi:AcrR family transcriptional regulator